MTGPPTVSVVLIFRDDERFLPASIASVRTQTYTDWELLLVDDGSTDASSDIARDHAGRDRDRVTYLEHAGHENRGISATRNLGWRAARGRYVAFLDSDDVWKERKLADQVTILEAHAEVGLLVGASLYWWSWAGADAPGQDRTVAVGAPSDRVHPPGSLLHRLYPLGRGDAPCPSSIVVRRDVLEQVAGFEDRFRGMYEDQAFLVKAYAATSVWVSSQCWDRYRRHGGSLMVTTTAEGYHDARQRFLRWYTDHLREQAIADPALWLRVWWATWPYDHPRLAAIRRVAGRTRARSAAVRRRLMTKIR